MGRRVGPEETFDEDLGLFAPPHNGTATSAAAAERIKPSAETLRARVLEYIRLCSEGCTREEIEIGLEMSGSTVRPRVLELLKIGKIRELEGVTRATSSGRQAAILVAVSKPTP